MPIPSGADARRRSTTALLAQLDARARHATGRRPARPIGARFVEEQRALRPVDVAFVAEAATVATITPRGAGARRTARTTRCRVAWAGLDLTGVGRRDDGHGGRPRRPPDHASAASASASGRSTIGTICRSSRRSRRRCGRCCRSCSAIWAPPFPAVWDRAARRSTARGRRRAHFAKILGQLETRGAAVVVPALEAALAQRHAAPAGADARRRGRAGSPREAVPAALRDLEIGSGTAADYDAWLQGGAA